MSIAVRIDMRGVDKLNRFSSRLNKVVPNEAGDSLFKISKIMANGLRAGAMNDPKRPLTSARRTAAMKIKGKRISKFRSGIVMPSSLINLDSQSAHYVALKPGRKITKWAKKYFNGTRVSGRSRVLRGPRRGILYTPGRKSALFVTPHKFIQKTLRKEIKKLPTNLKHMLKKAISISRR